MRNCVGEHCEGRMIITGITLLIIHQTVSQADVGRLPTVIETHSLPMQENEKIDSRLMASIGNGHLATVIYNDSVYLNGVYNGLKAASHRARIPAEINVRVHIPNKERENVYRQYKLDMGNGYWEENITVQECRVTQRVYAHQFYTRLLVTEILAQRQGATRGNILLYLNISRGDDSADINFAKLRSFNGGNWRTFGSTVQPEEPGGHISMIHAFWTLVPPVIHIPSHMDQIRHTFIMSLDTNLQVARESFESGTWIADKNPHTFFEMHKKAWAEKWSEGHIEIVGDPYLEKLAYASHYYLLSSLPSINSHRQMNPFGGLSAEGLARGGSGSWNQGHVGRDQDMWILPAVLPFFPSLARTMLEYRVNTLPAALTISRNNGYVGSMFGWKTAATGADVSKCPSCNSDRVHINGEIALAARQYVTMTRDKSWLQEKKGCILIRELAKFFFSRSEKNKRRDIMGVTTSDDSSGRVDNSVYTNAVASLALHFSKYTSCLCNKDVNSFAPKEWIEAAQNFHWEFNNTWQYHPQYHNYKHREGLKRAKLPDVVLLGYPVMWNMSKTLRESDLNYYSSITSDISPAITRSMHTIGWLEVGQKTRADELFTHVYTPYVSEPFKVWSEYSGHLHTTNHLTGMSAFIQSLLYGYGGLRIHTEYLTLNPQLPRDVTSMTFVNIDYLGSKLDIRLTDLTVDIQVKAVGIYPLLLVTLDTGQRHHLIKDARITIQRGAFSIKTKSGSGCPLPDDNILPFMSKSTSQYAHSSAICVTWTLSLIASLIILCN